MNIIFQLEFELAYFYVAAQNFIHYATGTFVYEIVFVNFYL